jgi:hypothetical protein
LFPRECPISAFLSRDDWLTGNEIGTNMALLEKAQLSFEAWSNGLDAADSAALGVIGFGLMIFAVAALLVQRHFEKRISHTDQTTQRSRPCRPVLGLRHNRTSCAENKSGRFFVGQKKDPFLSRLERLA